MHLDKRYAGVITEAERDVLTQAVDIVLNLIDSQHVFTSANEVHDLKSAREKLEKWPMRS